MKGLLHSFRVQNYNEEIIPTFFRGIRKIWIRWMFTYVIFRSVGSLALNILTAGAPGTWQPTSSSPGSLRYEKRQQSAGAFHMNYFKADAFNLYSSNRTYPGSSPYSMQLQSLSRTFPFRLCLHILQLPLLIRR
jgi:hypothetical protein